jgi:outer membrane protein assembly factor BamB
VPPEAAPPAPVAADFEPARVTLDFAGSGDWPTFHGDAARSGLSSAPAVAAPQLRWRARVGIQSWLNSPLVVGSAVIVPSCGSVHDAPDKDDGVSALDLATGQLAWRAAFPNDANGAAASKDRVFVTSDDGQLRALSLASGAELWRRAGLGKLYTHPLLAGDAVVVGDASGHLRAYGFDGRPIFDLALTGPIRGGASADARSIYAASQGGDVVAVSREGRLLWRTRVDHPPWGGRGAPQIAQIYSPPVVTETSVILPFARDTYYKDAPALVALDKLTGTLKWRARGSGDFGNVRSTPVLVAGALIYAEPYSGDVVAISVASGRMLYRHTIGRCFFPQWASPAAAGDVAYVSRFDGVLHALRANDGRTLWSYYVGDSRRVGPTIPSELAPAGNCDWEVPVGNAAYSPIAIARDGTILVGTHEGYLYAIGEARP